MSYKRSQETKKRYESLYAKTKHKYARGCWYDEEQDRLIRFQMSKKGRGNRYGWVKHRCNKKVRRYKGDLSAKGTYRKIAEFWWEVF